MEVQEAIRRSQEVWTAIVQLSTKLEVARTRHERLKENLITANHAGTIERYLRANAKFVRRIDYTLRRLEALKQEYDTLRTRFGPQPI